jgi:hypothetical protein
MPRVVPQKGLVRYEVELRAAPYVRTDFGELPIITMRRLLHATMTAFWI